jgi:hypothetical protein
MRGWPFQSAARTMPTVTVTPTTSRAPPIRSSGASGPLTWATARLERGTPPKGHCQRTHSASMIPAGRATNRPGPRGATTVPAARNPA